MAKYTWCGMVHPWASLVLMLACMEMRATAFSVGIHANRTNQTNGNAGAAPACDTSKWPDKDHGLVCGKCKVLVDNMAKHYGGKCDNYCHSMQLSCVGAWDESHDTCKVKTRGSCSTSFDNSDAICQCAPKQVSLQACVNTPQWSDTWGTCAVYVRNKWCSADGTEGSGWDASWGPLDPSVVRACCKCGKQSRKAAVTSPPTVPTLSAPVKASTCAAVTKNSPMPPPCATTTLRAGGLCSTKVAVLKPTQAVVGMQHMECKRIKYNGKSASKMDKYIKEHVVPVVLGPSVQSGLPQYYVTDHHHFTRALGVSKYANSNVIVCVTNDFRHLSTTQFWTQMKALHLVWLRNNYGLPITPAQLPPTIGAIKLDDPYRSLSSIVEDSLGYIKCEADEITWSYSQCKPPPSVYFLEFKWGQVMRQAKVLPAAIYSTPAALQYKTFVAVATRALGVVLAPKVKALNGFNQDPSKQCLKSPLRFDPETGCEDSHLDADEGVMFPDPRIASAQ